METSNSSTHPGRGHKSRRKRPTGRTSHTRKESMSRSGSTARSHQAKKERPPPIEVQASKKYSKHPQGKVSVRQGKVEHMSSKEKLKQHNEK